MAHRTISISPVSADISEEFLTNLLSKFKALRSKIDRETRIGYVEFADPDCLEALGTKYQDCKLKQLQNAEITPIAYDWNDATSQAPFNSKCLISIKKCDRLKLTEDEIKEIFKGLTVKRHLISQSKSQIIVELGTLSELQMLQNKFAGLLVPELGENAFIDIENEINSKKFIKKWTERKTKLEIAKRDQERLAEQMRNMQQQEQQKLDRQMRIDKQYKQAKEEEELRNLRRQQNETQKSLPVVGQPQKMEIDLAKIHQAKSQQTEIVKEKVKQEPILVPQKVQPVAKSSLEKVDEVVPSRQVSTEVVIIPPAVLLIILLGWLYLLISS